jgi:hypothetical protein
MLAYLDRDFVKMTEGFFLIVGIALVSFYILNYLSQDPELGEIVSSIFNSITR